MGEDSGEERDGLWTRVRLNCWRRGLAIGPGLVRRTGLVVWLDWEGDTSQQGGQQSRRREELHSAGGSGLSRWLSGFKDRDTEDGKTGAFWIKSSPQIDTGLQKDEAIAILRIEKKYTSPLT